jgi:hypothetical protein
MGLNTQGEVTEIMDKEPDIELTRQEARAEKLRKKRAKIKQHGKGLGKIYIDAVEKRGKGK